MKRKVSIKDVVCSLFLSGYSIFLCLLSPLNVFSNEQSATDSTVFRYVALEMAKGNIPYKDTFDHKGPLIYFLNYLGLKIDDRLGIWIIELLCLVCTCYFLYKTANMFCGKMCSVIAVVATTSLFGVYFQGGNLTEEYALPFISISVYFLTKYLVENKIKKWDVFWCGISMAAVLMLRPNMIAVWIGFVAVILIKEIANKQWKRIQIEIGYFSAGLIIGMIPFFIYLISAGAMKDFFDAYLLFNLKYQKGADISRIIRAFKYYFLQPIVFLSLFSLVFAYIKAIKEKIKSDAWIIYCNFLSMFFTYVFLCMPGSRTPHYGMVLIPVLIMPIAMVLSKISRNNPTSLGRLFVATILLSMALYSNGEKIFKNIKIDTNSKYEYQTVVDIISVYTDEDDVISVFGNKNSIYLTSNRLSASKYSYQFPLVYYNSDIYLEYKSDIQEKMPKIIVISEENETFMSDFLSYIDSLGYYEIEDKIYAIR